MTTISDALPPPAFVGQQNPHAEHQRLRGERALTW